MKETGGHSVKLEGGSEIIESIERILTAGIPVMGHLGLTPQSIYKFGTYTVRFQRGGRNFRKINRRCKIVRRNRLFAIVLEKVPC